ncbi:MAG: nicotinate-nucleotide adenylyltransferase [Candidatus Omnitrophica bacterium]|nr:nicotinate-nucleotide adenylyltransferase [Candidatus Omnitrophota bacterium]
MKQIGLLGGTFNPIHNGHLALAQTALEGLKLDKVIFVPAKVPVHKEAGVLISATKRFKMVELAIKGYKQFEISDVEIKRDGKSYSIDTAIHFRGVFPTAKLYFIIGSDSCSRLHTWKEIDELDQLLTFVCINRAGVKPKGNHKNCLFLEMPELDISSSDIRKRISKRLPVGYMLPDAVNLYIQKNKIYL